MTGVMGAMVGMSPRPFDPSRLAATKAWWSPDFGITKDTASRVSSWADKIAGHTAIQATAASQPLWVENAATMLGGERALVRCDSNARFLEMTNFPATFPLGTDETWIFAASRMTATGSVWTPSIISYAGQRGIGYGGSNWSTQTPNNTNYFSVMRSSGSDAFQVAPSMLTNAIVAARFGAAGIIGRRNGAQVGTSSDGVSIATGNLRIGRRTNGVDNIVGYIGDIIVTGALTEAEYTKMEGWLAWRYAQQSLLPAAHPYKTRRP